MLNLNTNKIKISTDSLTFCKQVFSSVTTHSFGLLVAFTGSIFLTRALGVEGRGILSWIISFNTIGIILVQLGIGFVGRKFVAKNPKLTSDIFLISIIVCSIGAVVVLPILAFVALQNPIGRDNYFALIVGLIAAFIGGLGAAWGEILVGLKNSKGYNIIILVQKISTTALYFTIILLAITSPLTATLCITTAITLKALTALYFLRNNIKLKLQKPKMILSSTGIFMFSNYIASVALYLSRIIILILLGILASDKEVGLYAAPIIIVEAVIMVPQMIGMYLVPKLVSIKEPRKYALFASYTTSFVAISMSAGAGFFYLIADWLIPFLYGKNFAPSSEVFKTLLIGMIFFSLANIFQSIIIAKDKGIKVATAPILSFISSVIFCNLLIPTLGARGAAYTWTASSFVLMIVAGGIVVWNTWRDNRGIKTKIIRE